MSSGLRARLLLASLAVLIAIGVPVALLLRAELDAMVEDRARTELAAWARGAASEPDIAAAIDRLGAASHVQLDLISADGVMIASSGNDAAITELLSRPETHD